MLVCVEAGQSLDQSIIRVGKESRDRLSRAWPTNSTWSRKR
jgi:hypothetical protein